MMGNRKETSKTVRLFREGSEGKTVADVFNTLNEEQKAAVQRLADLYLAEREGDKAHFADEAEKERLCKVFDSFGEEQKTVTYAILGMLSTSIA